MSKYSFDKINREISGFGGGYEQACRDMVIAGLEWWDEHPDAAPTFKQSPSVFGVTKDENADMDAMQKAMNEAAKNEATGAMMQACTNHVLKARAVGWDEYTRLMNERA